LVSHRTFAGSQASHRRRPQCGRRPCRAATRAHPET
jgi:hypothetical protein